MCRVSSQCSTDEISRASLLTKYNFENCLKYNGLQIRHRLGIGQHSDQLLICQGLLVHGFIMLSGFEDAHAVVENLFIVLQPQAHCDRYKC